jgi:hypothetical protein
MYFGIALHLQKYMYLFFALPLVVMGLLAAAPALSRSYRRALLVAVWVVSAVAFVFLAGPVRQIVPGRSGALVSGHGIPRCSLLLEPYQADFYKRLLGLIDREVATDESILVLPVNSELYYLSGRRNPTRFYLSATGLRTPADVRALENTFEQSPPNLVPKLVFYHPKSSYVTAECRQLMDWVAWRYEPLEPQGDFQVYRRRGGGE